MKKLFLTFPLILMLAAPVSAASLHGLALAGLKGAAKGAVKVVKVAARGAVAGVKHL